MKLIISIILILSLLGCLSTADLKDELQSCFDKLKENNITAKPINYSQLVDLGVIYGQMYCRVQENTPHPYSCDRFKFNAKQNPNGPELLTLTLQIIPTNSFSANFEVIETEIPGVFMLAEQGAVKILPVTKSNARVMAVLDIQPDILVYYLCSVDIFDYNDFRVNTVAANPDLNQLRPVLQSHVSSKTCHYFNTSRKSCSNTNIPLIPQYYDDTFKSLMGNSFIK